MYNLKQTTFRDQDHEPDWIFLNCFLESLGYMTL